MHAEDHSSHSSRSSKSSVWIDPVYMRHSYVSEPEASSLSSQADMSDEARRHATSTRENSSRSQRRPRQPDPITPTPPTLDVLPNAPSPIPPRASAQRGNSAHVPIRYVGTQFSAPDAEAAVPRSSRSEQMYRPVPPRQSHFRQTRKLTSAPEPDALATSEIAPVQQRSPMWQYDSPDYEIESSIAALSLVVPDAPAPPAPPVTSDPFAADPPLIDELPTCPEQHVGSRLIDSTAELPTRPELATASPVADLPTRPEHRNVNASPISALAELDTVPPLILSPAPHTSAAHDPDLPTQALIPAHAGLLQLANPSAGAQLIVRSADLSAYGDSGLVSWTAGGAGQSPLAQRLIERRVQRDRRLQRNSSSSVHLNPLDRVRWWLLKPGHIEFIVWLAGTILLIAVSLALLFTTSLSFGWLTIGPLSHFSSSSSDAHPLPTIVTDPALKLELQEKGPFLPGQTIGLRGQGFTHDGDIFFTYDNMQLFSAQGTMTKADAQGTFTVTLTLGTGQQWYPGLHLIEARDLVSGHLAAVKISILAPDSQNGSNGTNAPVSTAVPGKSTPTPVSGSGNGNKPTPGPDPGGQTPVPIPPTATVGLTPTPTLSPSPTPTSTNTPTPTPTPTNTPTPTPGVTPTPTP